MFAAIFLSFVQIHGHNSVPIKTTALSGRQATRSLAGIGQQRAPQRLAVAARAWRIMAALTLPAEAGPGDRRAAPRARVARYQPGSLNVARTIARCSIS